MLADSQLAAFELEFLLAMLRRSSLFAPFRPCGTVIVGVDEDMVVYV